MYIFFYRVSCTYFLLIVLHQTQCIRRIQLFVKTVPYYCSLHIPTPAAQQTSVPITGGNRHERKIRDFVKRVGILILNRECNKYDIM